MIGTGVGELFLAEHDNQVTLQAMTDSQKFRNALKGLNAEQLKAVNTIEGPVMVVAGPGSGKTQILALRVANILTKTQLGPRNILVLTFTDAGVVAVRERLNSYIGALSYQVTVSTFHSFANEVIGTFSHIFSATRQLKQLDEMERILLVEKLLRKNRRYKILKPLRAENRHVKNICSAVKTCKQEAIEPKQILDFSNELLSNSSELKKSDQEKSVRQAEVLKEFAEIYRDYQEDLEKSLRYDYEDMILLVIKALAENSEIKAYFQERYQYILVDEYQDTNNAQNKLVELLTDFFEIPNIFVVGDDKQAIYRFQGASVANMLHFHQFYPHLKIISLRENYRSTPEIISAAEKLIGHNQTQLSAVLTEVSTKMLTVKKGAQKPQLILASTSVAEQLEITQIVSRLIRDGIKEDQIALLVRTNAEAVSWRTVLEKSNIQVAGVQSTDLLRENEAQLLISVLKAIIRPTNDTAITTYLRSISKAEYLIGLIELISRARANKKSIIAQAQNDKVFVEQISLLLEWHKLLDKLSPVELIEEIVYRGKIIDYLRARPNRLSGLELFSALINQLRDFSQKNQASTLEDWLEYLELHKNYDIKFTVQKSQAEVGGVVVTTVHQAKGLEYEAVILPNMTDKNWRVKANRDTIKLPTELVVGDSEENSEVEDLRRLLFVAMTRAKKELIFSYPVLDDKGKDQLPCQFIAEINDQLEKITPKVNQKNLENFIVKQLSPTPQEQLSETELTFVREKFQSMAFSFTAYCDYKKCPRTFLLRHIYNFPTPFIPSLAYGSAVHKSLELFAKEYKGLKILPDRTKLINYFIESLEKSLPFGNRDEFLEQGKLVLKNYYDGKLSASPIPAHAEYSFTPHKVMLDDIWLTGKIDLIETINPVTLSVKVIDYKTGSQSRTRNYIEGKTQDSDGSIKTQLIFYALLCQLDKLFPYQAKEFEIRYVDDKLAFKDICFEITQAEIAELIKDIKKVYKEILEQTVFPIGDEQSEIALLFPTLNNL